MSKYVDTLIQIFTLMFVIIFSPIIMIGVIIYWEYKHRTQPPFEGICKFKDGKLHYYPWGDWVPCEDIAAYRNTKTGEVKIPEELWQHLPKGE